MKYHIVEDAGFFIIKISGEPKKNEALQVKSGQKYPLLLSKGKRHKGNYGSQGVREF
jgi:hypothetical protein